MTYNKPEVAVLGDASCVIQGIRKPQGLQPDPQTGVKNFPPPAYDLDE